MPVHNKLDILTIVFYLYIMVIIPLQLLITTGLLTIIQSTGYYHIYGVDPIVSFIEVIAQYLTVVNVTILGNV